MTTAFSYGLQMGNWSYTVSTNCSEAQQWFDVGWIQMWGFNHEEAIRCYEKALSYDPNMLMAFVGLALSYGPDYNNEDGFSTEIAHNYSQQALAMVEDNSTVSNFTEEEEAIVRALSVRAKKNSTSVYWDPKAYVDSLRNVYVLYGNTSLAVTALFAEALMLANPWALWEKDAQGNIVAASSETTEVVSVLETALEKTHDYPPFCHLYIHVMEQSADPMKALVHANHLRGSVPDQGHLRHMPSHIDVWVGHYQEAVDANLVAIAVDAKYFSVNGNHTQEYYKKYVLHNHHFLLWACMFTAQSGVAMKYAHNLQAMISNPSESFIVKGGMQITAADFDVFGFAPWQVMFRFAQWKSILAEPIPSNSQIYPATIATAYLTRGIAYAVTGRVKEAEAEKVKFEQAVQNPALKGKKLQTNLMWNENTVIDTSATQSNSSECGVLNVGYYVLQGMIEHAKNKPFSAGLYLEHAVALEDCLNYAEPWGWMSPTRHTLGQVLLTRRMFIEAERVFRDDLEVYPNNLWALNGLHQSLTAQGKSTEAASVMSSYTTAASRADIDVRSVLSFGPAPTVSSAPHVVLPYLFVLGAWAFFWL